MASDSIISMRQGDRLPIIAVAVEDDQARPLDMSATGTSAYMCFRMLDGSPLFPSGYPWSGPDWYEQSVLIANGPGGVVSYDWSEIEADNVGIGIIELAVRVFLPGVGFGASVYAPTDGHAYIVMRSRVYPIGTPIPGTYGADKYGTGVYADPTPVPITV